MDARNEHASKSMAPAAMVEQLLTEIAPAATPNRQHLQGFGTIYRRGRVWWIKWSKDGKRRRESSKSERDTDAIKLLRRRIEEQARDSRRDPGAENRVTMAQLFDALVADYTANGRRSGATLAFRLAPLREAFGQGKAHDVKASSIKRYTDQRRAAGKAPATINRELAALRRAFTIAVEQERLSSASIPRVKLFAEHNARQGFLERADFEAVVSRLPVYLQDYARFAYGSGWRKGEVATLEWSAVDKGTTRVTLRREHSKNGEPRVLPLVGELTEIIARRRQERAYTTVAGETAESRYIFHRHGAPVGDFRKAWAAACVEAGLYKVVGVNADGSEKRIPSRLFHDLRRSGVRNMVRAGVRERVAMEISGHRTRSIFDRYNITSEDDLREAMQRTTEYVRAQPAQSNVLALPR